ncbi:MAG TPA: carbohydrate-binding protein [Polyangiaceae bacterium]|nr:carbohydrate-binding protein [Polyangiaceae bacterium]
MSKLEDSSTHRPTAKISRHWPRALALTLGVFGTLALLVSSGCQSAPRIAENRSEGEGDLGQVQSALTDYEESHVTGNVWYVDNQAWLMKGVNWDPSEPCEYYTQYNWNRAEGDATLMQANGFNTVRTYGFTSGKSGLPENGYITMSQLDSFYNHGIRVILAVHSAPGDSTWTGTTSGGNPLGSGIQPSTGDFTQAAKDRITMLAGHPAVIALGLGNEVRWNYFYTKDPGGAWTNGWDVTGVINHAKYVATKIRALTSKPISLSWGNTADINRMGEFNGSNVDIISYQIYNNLSLDNIFNLHPQYSGKPFFMSEFGSDAWNQNSGGVDEGMQRNGNNNLFKQILDNAKTGAGGQAGHKIVGGTVFSWSDGWWKAGNPCSHEAGGIAPGVGPHSDLTFNEEYWGLCDGEGERNCRQTLGDLKNLFALYPSGGGSGPVARNIANNLEVEGNDGCSNPQHSGEAPCGLENTADAGGGKNMGWANPGDWVEWRVNIPTTGSYKVTSRSASWVGSASYNIRLDGGVVSNKTMSSTGGSQNWQSQSTNEFFATAGEHTLRFEYTSDGQNLNWVKVEAHTGGGGGGLRTGTIEAESWNQNSGTGTEACSEGGSNVQDVGDGEWTRYDNVDLNGVTSFDARVASNNFSGSIEFRRGSPTGTLLATCSAPYTSGWQNWTTVSCSTGAALSGTDNVHLVYRGGSQWNSLPNINWWRPVIGGTSGGGGGTGSQPTRLRVTNQCNEPIWMGHQEGTGNPVIPDSQRTKIDPGKSYDYTVPAGYVPAVRFMPRTGCDANGANCKTGMSMPLKTTSGAIDVPCPAGGCQPPIESKFEGTFGPVDGSPGQGGMACGNSPFSQLGECLTWYNASFVDGYTLPMKVVPKIVTPRADCTPLDASGLSLDQCPTGDRLGPNHQSVNLRVMDGTKIVGCLSPCKKMNYIAPWGYGMPEGQEPAVHMCCPTPYPNNTPLQCTWANGCGTSDMCNSLADPNAVVHTQYVNRLQSMAPAVYSFAYDDADSLRTCVADTKFEVIYCPGGSSGSGGGSGTCSDGVKNQTETGVDCGGPCSPCISCSDGVKNGNETGVDCGGSCAACANCADGIQNQGETGVDCGGPCAACSSSFTLQAESHLGNGGITFNENCSEGGQNLAGIGEGEYIILNNNGSPINFGGVTQFQLRVASNMYAANIEVRKGSQGGPLMATCSAPVTGGWQTWQTVTCNVTATQTGSDNLALVWHKNPQPFSGTDQLPNLNWVKVVGGSNTGATLYADCPYAGTAVNLGPGDYPLASLGLADNALSSIKVAAGYQAVLYNDDNFAGYANVVTGDTACLTNTTMGRIDNTNWNDKVTSVRIQPMIAEGNYILKNVGTNKCADVAGGTMGDGVNIQQYTCNNSSAQRFTISRKGLDGDTSPANNGALYEIRRAGTAFCADVDHGYWTNAAELWQWTCNNSGAQRYYLIGLGGGQYEIRRSAPGQTQCVDLNGGNSADGTNIFMWGCTTNGNNNQKYYIQPN